MTPVPISYSLRLLVVRFQLFFQQVAQCSAAGSCATRLVLIDCCLLFITVLRFDRQCDCTALAVNASELGFNFVAYVQYVRSIFYTLARDFRNA